MKNAFRQSMAWLHTWAGLLLGCVLYFMFLTGTLGYFDTIEFLDSTGEE